MWSWDSTLLRIRKLRKLCSPKWAVCNLRVVGFLWFLLRMSKLGQLRNITFPCYYWLVWVIKWLKFISGPRRDYMLTCGPECHSIQRECFPRREAIIFRDCSVKGWCQVVLLVLGRWQVALKTNPNAVFSNASIYRPLNHSLSRVRLKLSKLPFLYGSKNGSLWRRGGWLGCKSYRYLHCHWMSGFWARLTSSLHPLWVPLLSPPVVWGWKGD